MYKKVISIFLLFMLCSQAMATVRIKEIARIQGVRDNAITGYGLMVGLAGTGDSRRSAVTNQSVVNVLANFGINVAEVDLNSRNVAIVTLTTILPPFAQIGDRLDVQVSSMGDARSLSGGSLLLAPLKGPNNAIYALAQGAISVGAYSYEFNGNSVQKNHPTVGVIPEGAIVEKDVSTNIISHDGFVNVVLAMPDYTTAHRIQGALEKSLVGNAVKALHAGRVSIKVSDGDDIVALITRIENTLVVPDKVARVVVNERTGTIVSGGDVLLDNVTIAHGSIKVVISTVFTASQPISFRSNNPNVQTVVVANSDLAVEEDRVQSVSLPDGTRIGDLVSALQQINTSTRDVISILQAVKKAGALHAQLIIQ